MKQKLLTKTGADGQDNTLGDLQVQTRAFSALGVAINVGRNLICRVKPTWTETFLIFRIKDMLFNMTNMFLNDPFTIKIVNML